VPRIGDRTDTASFQVRYKFTPEEDALVISDIESELQTVDDDDDDEFSAFPGVNVESLSGTNQFIVQGALTTSGCPSFDGELISASFSGSTKPIFQTDERHLPL
jgi:hypothetical protein